MNKGNLISLIKNIRDYPGRPAKSIAAAMRMKLKEMRVLLRFLVDNGIAIKIESEYSKHAPQKRKNKNHKIYRYYIKPKVDLGEVQDTLDG